MRGKYYYYYYCYYYYYYYYSSSSFSLNSNSLCLVSSLSYFSLPFCFTSLSNFSPLLYPPVTKFLRPCFLFLQ